MRPFIVRSAIWLILNVLSVSSYAEKDAQWISEEKAIQVAITEIGGDIIGIRFDKPDAQWDVFVQSGKHAYEVEVDAKNGAIISTEQESLEEIHAELSGDLSHEGVGSDIDK